MQVQHAALCVGLALGMLAAFWSTPTHSQTSRLRLGRGSATVHMGRQKPSSAFRCTPLTAAERLHAFGDLDGYTHGIATTSSNTQRFFDQGTMLVFGFNQHEALRSFSMAIAEDPHAPAPFWGIAYSSGPYLNKAAGPAEEARRGGYPVFSQQELEAGRAAVHQGLSIAHEQLRALGNDSSLGDKEQDYVKALERDTAYLEGIAHVYDSGATYGPAFEAGVRQYALSLQEWASAHPEDNDALALAAEALANLQPWDFWDESRPPQPKPGTQDILRLTRAALDRAPTHPLALHLLIHGTEAAAAGSEGAGQALSAAAQLSSNFIGHLQHMPSHTYLRTGYWSKGVRANEGAHAIDATLAAGCIEPFSPYHNTQMLMYMAMAGGMLEKAEQWGAVYNKFPEIFGPSYVTDGRDHLMLPLAWLRFGKWRRLMELEPAALDPTLDGVSVSPQSSPFSKAMFHVMRSFAHAAVAAQEEDHLPLNSPRSQHGRHGARQRAYDELHAAEDVAASLLPDQITKPGHGLGVYSSAFKAMSTHAILMLRARLAVLEGNFSGAALHLNSAQEVDGTSGYMEPPRFYQPALDCLGWVLLQDGELKQAAGAYMQALREYPRSPWALTGLRHVLKSTAGREKGVVAGTEVQQHQQQQQPQQQAEGTFEALPGGGKGESRYQRLVSPDAGPAQGRTGAVGVGAAQLTQQADEVWEKGAESLGAKQGAQGSGDLITGSLPADIPSLEQVEALLAELAAEAEGQADVLPSSCPSFSEAYHPE